MDGAVASSRYPTVGALCERYTVRLRRVGGRGGRVEVLGASRRGAAVSADLGGSSNYSNENFEDRSGEGFLVNSS